MREKTPVPQCIRTTLGKVPSLSKIACSYEQQNGHPRVLNNMCIQLPHVKGTMG